MIYKYQPAVTTGPNGSDPRPSDPGEDALTELCTLDGWRYVSVPDGIAPIVPDALTTWQAVTVTPELREQIKAASPACRLISQQIVARIRANYSLDHELYLARIGIGTLQGTYTPSADEQAEIMQYQIDVEASREWGRQQRAAIGLTSE